MSELIRLVKLRNDLQQGAAALVQAAEAYPSSPNLNLYIQIADRCMRLERDVSLLARDLLEVEEPRGAA